MRHFLTTALLYVLASAAFAQPRGGPEVYIAPPETEPDATTPAQILAEVRAQRITGDFILQFELTHLPRRGERTEYGGLLWGTWANGGPRLRVELETAQATRPAMIIQSGPFGHIISSEPATESTGQPGGGLFDPVIPGTILTPFELQLPFLYWEAFTFEGKVREQGQRNTYQFIMHPPETLRAQYPAIGPVRIVLDAQFRALVEAEMLDAKGNVLKTFDVRSFKKIDDQYIVRTIDLRDEETKDKTRFRVVLAATRLNLDERLWEAETLTQSGEAFTEPVELLRL